MNLSEPRHDTVLYVVSRMRESDRQEIYALRNHTNPFLIVNDVMARPEMTWVMWHDNLPAVVIGGIEMWPGTWSIHCFGTDAFSRLAIPLTRFVKKQMLPIIFDQFGARRAQAYSHESHKEAHRWMELCGAHREGVLRGYGGDGADYHIFAIVKPPFRQLDNPDKSC